MIVIGIIGNSGSGKTTISNIISKRPDVKIINADEVAKNMQKEMTPYLEEIKKEFGEELFDKNNNLDRRILAEKIYSNYTEKEKLDKITFKYVVQEIVNAINKNRNNGTKILVIDAPLLIESNLDKQCDYIIALVAKKDIKINRICARDGIDKETAEKRLNIQPKDDFYYKRANFIIENQENTNLEEELNLILNKIL